MRSAAWAAVFSVISGSACAVAEGDLAGSGVSPGGVALGGAAGWASASGGSAGAAAGGAGGVGATAAGGTAGVAGPPSAGGAPAGPAGGAAGVGAGPTGAPASNGTQIQCNGSPCQALAQHCCINGEGSGTPPSFQCIPLAIDCGLMALDRQCDASEDCKIGERCCANTTFPSTPSKCRTECLTGEQPTCWTGAECGASGSYCCFFPGRPAGFCKDYEHPGAALCAK